MTKPAAIGDLVTVRGHLCRVFAIHPAHTFDVESLDSEHAFRICGLLQSDAHGVSIVGNYAE